MITYILIGIVVVLVVLVLAVSSRPGTFCISRSGSISAPPDAVFPHVNELRKWEAWNPWGKLDPEMKAIYEGPASGVGSKYTWIGNRNVGEGRMTITESRPGNLLRIKLEFLKPFAATNDTEFTFKPEGGGTTVTWTMSGRNNFMSKAMGLFINMDKMIGGNFEKGLEDLKSVVESKD